MGSSFPPMRAAVVLLLLSFGSAAAAHADTPRVARVAAIDGGAILILEDGTRVRLAGIDLPRDTMPGAGETRAALEILAAGRLFRIGSDVREDRHGRLVAHLHREDGIWLQKALLEAGQARVRTGAEERTLGPEMLAIEAEARQARRGLWRFDAYGVRQAEGNPGPPDMFQLVEGVVAAVQRVGDRIYLNFGGDWRTDFTAVIETRTLKRFIEVGIDPQALTGKRVRVRGWMYERNGPAVDLTHPEQIELLDGTR